MTRVFSKVCILKLGHVVFKADHICMFIDRICVMPVLTFLP